MTVNHINTTILGAILSAFDTKAVLFYINRDRG